MNVRNTILLLTLGFFLVSCDEIKSRLNQDDSPVVSGEDTISDVEDETIVESDNPRTKNFYTSLLESFCNKYFDEHFSGDIYEKGSLVSGTHSYKVEMGSKVSGQMFKATISEKGDNLYDIKFEKGSSKVFSDNSYWDSIEMEYHYE